MILNNLVGPKKVLTVMESPITWLLCLLMVMTMLLLSLPALKVLLILSIVLYPLKLLIMGITYFKRFSLNLILLNAMVLLKLSPSNLETLASSAPVKYSELLRRFLDTVANLIRLVSPLAVLLYSLVHLLLWMRHPLILRLVLAKSSLMRWKVWILVLLRLLR